MATDRAADWTSVVGDVVVISDRANLPPGYQLVEPPFVISETNENRYLAYKKQSQAPKSFAVTDIAVRNDLALVPPGYKTMNYTTPDNLESFPDKVLMVKKDGWSAVLKGIPQAVTDVMLLRKSQRDDMPCGYKMTHDINGLCICFKRNDLKYYGGLDDEEDDDDVFGEELIGSDDDDFYEIPSSTAAVTRRTASSVSQGTEDTDGNSMLKPGSRKLIKSLPIDETGKTDDGIYPQVSQSILLSPMYSNLHLLPNSFGYPVDQFLSPPPPSALCAKCNNVLLNPYSLSCCNSYVCDNCLIHIQQSVHSKCPSCGSCEYDFESSIQMKENVDLLLLRCSNSDKGCKWRGQLGELEAHLFVTCSCEEIPCDNNCGAKFMRRDASKHNCGSSENRRTLTSYSRSASCVEELSHRINEIQKKQNEAMSVVKNELRKFHSVKDANSSESNYIKLSFEVKSLKRQLAESVSKEKALEAKVKQHEEEIRILKETHDMFRLQFDNLIDQLQMKSVHNASLLPISPVASPTTLKQPPCEFVIDQFPRYLKTPDAEWYSEPFVSDVSGYKFCLQVVPNGMMSFAGKDVSICIKLMRGEFDDHLKWPFQGKITVQILNWLCDQRHATRVIDFNADARRYGACGRVPVGCVGDRATKGWGILPFLPHGYLPFNKERGTEFLRSNCVCIRIASVTM